MVFARVSMTPLQRYQQDLLRPDFVADAAHQMRTPLTGLKTQAQLAFRETDPAALRHALRQIATGVLQHHRDIAVGVRAGRERARGRCTRTRADRRGHNEPRAAGLYPRRLCALCAQQRL